MEKQKKLKISFWMNIAIFVLEVIGAYLYLQRGGWNFVEFYTEDINTFAMIVCLILAFYEYRMLKDPSFTIPNWVKLLKYIAAICLTLTFLVVILVLIPMQGGGEAFYFFVLQGSMLYHHLICPILVFVSFLWLDPFETVSRKDMALSLIPTLIYAVVLMLLNVFHLVDGPYPFLKVYQQPVYMSCIWVLAILGGAYLIAALLARMLNRKTKA